MPSNSLGALFANRSNNFNLIRLFAALSVIYGHAGVVTGGGEPDILLRLMGYKFIGGVAVDVFFVLSGFLISASAQSGQGAIYYIASRVLRIYPALIVCVCLSILVLGVFYSGDSFDFFSVSTWRYLWVNSSALNTEYFLPGVFDGRPDKAINGSLWSIPVELRMYFVVLLLHFVGCLERKSIFNLLFFVCALLAFFRPSIFNPSLLHPSHLHVVGMFALGMFYWVNRGSVFINPWVLLMMLLFAGVVHGTPNFGYAYVILLPYALWCIAFSPGFFWFNRVGDYSYGVYLYGWPVQQCIAASFPSMTTLQNTMAAVIVALGMGFLSWNIVEKPSLQLKKLFRKRVAKRVHA
ncbi:acyltransferase family protein [Variovorax boronicumulans]|uniref:acyltransferase family protein n=1 Tax=Variovorax boronicumulans TaxID=436515 RepID=UPI001C567704